MNKVWSSGNAKCLALMSLFMMPAQSAVGSDNDSRVIKIASNRNDVVFYVRSGSKTYDITNTYSGTSNPTNEWELHPNHLAEALQNQLRLSKDEVDFSKFCGRADVGDGAPKEYCQTFVTLKNVNSLNFDFSPSSPALVSSSNQINSIENSPCSIIGSGNRVNCKVIIRKVQ